MTPFCPLCYESASLGHPVIARFPAMGAGRVVRERVRILRPDRILNVDAEVWDSAVAEWERDRAMSYYAENGRFEDEAPGLPEHHGYEPDDDELAYYYELLSAGSFGPAGEYCVDYLRATA